MPITNSLSLSPISQEEFAQLDYRVMRHAFECQNQLGRLCEEVIYQNDMAARLQAAGLSALKEVPVTVTHRDFTKTYSLDLVVANAGIYELKTALALAGAHEARRVVQPLPLTRGEVNLGKQCFHLLNPETAFRVTALTEGTSDYEHHLRSLLRLSPLRTLQWVNLARQRVQLVSLSR